MYAAVWVALYAAHVYYLAFIKFDYGYNMAASVGAGRSRLVRVRVNIPRAGQGCPLVLQEFSTQLCGCSGVLRYRLMIPSYLLPDFGV